MKNYVKQITELNGNQVFMKSTEQVNKIIHNLIDGGCGKLQVVSDFDKTITKQHENGKLHISSFGMFSRCPSVSEDHIKMNTELTKKYAPVEVDPNISMLEKKILMEEWWSLSEDSLKGMRVSPEEIARVCAELGPSLRSRTKEFFDELYKAEIPVLVFSAGLGDTVVAVLKHCDVHLSNVEVVSNFLKYDNEGTIVGFKNSIIHTYNKNEFAIKGSDFYSKVADRDNVILMGDTLGDANMVEGMEHLSSVLKIGFLYERSEEALPSYMDTFDIVLIDDQSMNIPMAIFNLIKNNEITQSTKLGNE
ncbi:unnamed protein product [Phaedon cochleariae]|uniref:5'-nucleotidase n=1 Tax=Phaedon cochleariae TaxID=80249 RepID=A0A9P0DJK9_PHACE|nr:unnamed protein product [Phaedon cochleariae]